MFFIGGEYINKRILLIFLFLIFFTCVQSAVAVSDMDCSSEVSHNYLSSSALSSDLISSDMNAISNDESSSNSNLDNYYVANSNSNLDSSDVANSNNTDNSTNSINETYSDSTSSDSTSSDSTSSNSTSSNSASSDSTSSNSASSNSTNVDSSNQIPQKILILNNSSITSAYIQKIIDDATPGSTIQFTGSFYKNLNLKINKALNIISKSGTIINMSFNLPVFTIGKGGSGTNISGFTANVPTSFVEASGVSNISISKNKISTKGTAIILENVHDSKIQNNKFLSFKTAIDISKSGGLIISKNNITPNGGNNIAIKLRNTDSKNKISILNNRIIGFDRRIESTAIYFGENARNVLIKGNVINEWYEAILFPNSINDVSIINNTFNHNGDGLIINGWINNFTFNQNVVTNTGRVGVLFDDDFYGTRGNFTVEKNFFTKSGHLDLRNTGQSAVSIGENFAARRCIRVNMKKGYGIKTRQSGNAYYFTIVDKDGRGVNGLPNFSATININGINYDVNFVDSVAYVETNGSSDGDAVLDIGEDMRSLNDWGETQSLESLDFYKKIYEDLIKSADETQSSQNNNGDSQRKVNNGTGSGGYNNGGGDSGISDGSSSVSSSGSSAGSSGSSSVSPSSPSSASPSNKPVESATAKSLSLDEETFRVAGVGGLVFLIICVIGLYYREDIYDMIKE